MIRQRQRIVGVVTNTTTRLRRLNDVGKSVMKVNYYSTMQRGAVSVVVPHYSNDGNSLFNDNKRFMVMVTNTKSDGNNTNAPVVIVHNNTTTANEAVTVTTSTTTSSAIQIESPNNMTAEPYLNITNSCWKRIQQLAGKKNKSLTELYLRIFVDAGGCSGFTYKFELEDDNIESTSINREEDIIFTNSDCNDARVVVDMGSYELLQGSTIDYVQEMIKSTFEVKSNPQSESACGCGSSFALKTFSKNPALD